MYLHETSSLLHPTPHARQTKPFSQLLGSLTPSIFLSPETSDEFLSSVKFLGAEINVCLKILLLGLHGLELIIESLQFVWWKNTED